MNLKERLEKIENLKKKVQQISHNHSGRKTFSARQSKPVHISELLTGNTVDTPYGPCFYTEEKIPLDRIFGDYSLAETELYFPGREDIYSFVYQDNIQDVELNQALFFDTETTGLAGGAGTYIFLMGLGFFTDDSFCVRQYFMSDYNEEEAFLWSINQLFSRGFKMLVSYNGKCYDFPLMQTRFIMTRIPMQLTYQHHLDLLFPTRRLWKRRLQDCSLSNIEKRVLNIQRNEDIPGYMIPHVYFRYLQNKDARPLKPVFAHNLQDIISLAILTTKIGQVLQDPFNAGIRKNGIDLFSIGKIFEGYKKYEFSSRCYEEALNCDLSDEQSLEVLKLASFAYKRQGNWKQAESTWRDIISLSKEFILYPYEELAKYYEHQLKDYSRANNIIEEALARLKEEKSDPDSKDKWIQELNHRMERINGKKEKGKQISSEI